MLLILEAYERPVPAKIWKYHSGTYKDLIFAERTNSGIICMLSVRHNFGNAEDHLLGTGGKFTFLSI